MPLHLTWETKKKPAPVHSQLETESFIFPQGAGFTAAPTIVDYPNRLIWGDNMAAMSALMPEYEGRIPLIYVDPPFFSNRHYPARIGRGEDSRRPKEW